MSSEDPVPSCQRPTRFLVSGALATDNLISSRSNINTDGLEAVRIKS